MRLPEHFLACPSCGCHVKSEEMDCPYCGGRGRRKEGPIPRTAAAILLVLTTIMSPALSTVACSSNVEGGGSGGDGGSGQGGGGQGGSSQMASTTASGTGMTVSSAAGVGGMATAYGVPI